MTDTPDWEPSEEMLDAMETTWPASASHYRYADAIIKLRPLIIAEEEAKWIAAARLVAEEADKTIAEEQPRIEAAERERIVEWAMAVVSANHAVSDTLKHSEIDGLLASLRALKDKSHDH